MRLVSGVCVGVRILAVGFIVVALLKGGVGSAEDAAPIEVEGQVVWAGSVEANIRSGAKVVHQRGDGSILIAGHGNMEKIQGVGLVAVTGRGEALWQRIYGTGRHLNQPLGLGSPEDNSSMLFGYLYDHTVRGGQVPWLASLTEDGSLIWERRYDSEALYRPSAFDVLPDGSTVLVGRGERTSPWVVRLDREGEVVWNRRLTRSGVGFGIADAKLTSESGVVLAGTMDRDAWVAKLSSNGETEWSVRAGEEKGIEHAIGVVETGDGGFLVAASTTAAGADSVLWLLRLDASGDVLWQSALGGPGFDKPRSAESDLIGGIWVVGIHRDATTEDGDGVPWIVHVDSEGSVLADMLVTEPGIVDGYDREVAGVGATSDGGAVFAARSMDYRFAVRVLKIDSVGLSAEGFPYLKSKDSTYRRIDLPVRPASFEVDQPDVVSSTVVSESLPVSYGHRHEWVVAGPEPRFSNGAASAGRPLPEHDESVRAEEVVGASFLMEQRFEELDLWAEGLVESRERDEYGWMLILAFYQDLKIDRQPLVQYGMEESVALMEDWHRERPNSIAARVALADAYFTLAWEHRGSGYGRDVTREGSLEKARYTEKAWTLLTEVYDDRPADPVYWKVLLGLSHVWGRAPPYPPEVLATALSIAPDYLPIYLNEAHFCVPQWGGDRREVERFAARSTDSETNPFGEELYARIAVSLARGSERTKVFGEHGFDWPRVRDGLRLINRRYPQRLNHHWAAFMAVLAGDRQETLRYLKADDGGYGDDVRKIWKSELAYNGNLEWASRPVGGTWAEKDVTDWPDLSLVIEAGSDPSASATDRLGFLLSRGFQAAPILVTAIDPRSAEYGSVEATLEVLGRGKRVASWLVLPRSLDGVGIDGLIELGTRKEETSRIPTAVVAARFPSPEVDLGVPELGVASFKGSGRVLWVVGCVSAASGCDQMMVSGIVGGSGSSGSFSLAVDADAFELVRPGAPVLDEFGNAIGVVYDRRFEGGSSSEFLTYQLGCMALDSLVPRLVEDGRYLVDMQSVGGRSAVEESVVKLIEARVWDELERLASVVADLRADDGGWIGSMVIDAFRRRMIDQSVRPGPDGFDEVGALLDEWVRESPSEPLATVAVVVHHLGSPPRPPKGVLMSSDEYEALRERHCAALGSVVAGLTTTFPSNIYGRVAAAQWASRCGGADDLAAALAELAAVAPDLTPIYARTISSLAPRLRWSATQTGEFIDSVLDKTGTEVKATLYGVAMINSAIRKESDPTIDIRRVAGDYENWIELYPGGSFSEARLLSLLCRTGETERAAARLEITLCSEVRISGTTWSKEICRECFGGDQIPRTGAAERSSPQN